MVLQGGPEDTQEAPAARTSVSDRQIMSGFGQALPEASSRPGTATARSGGQSARPGTAGSQSARPGEESPSLVACHCQSHTGSDKLPGHVCYGIGQAGKAASCTQAQPPAEAGLAQLAARQARRAARRAKPRARRWWSPPLLSSVCWRLQLSSRSALTGSRCCLQAFQLLGQCSERQVRTGRGVQALAQVNAAKVHTKWRDLLRQAKLVELQKEVKRIAEAHEAAVLAKSKLTEARCWSQPAPCCPASLPHLRELQLVQELIVEVAEAAAYPARVPGQPAGGL